MKHPLDHQAAAFHSAARWLVWLDADAILLNFHKPLEDFVESNFDLRLGPKLRKSWGFLGGDKKSIGIVFTIDEWVFMGLMVFIVMSGMIVAYVSIAITCYNYMELSKVMGVPHHPSN